MEAKGRKGKITPASGIKDKKEKQRKEREGGGSKKIYVVPPDKIPDCSSCGPLFWKIEMTTAETADHWLN